MLCTWENASHKLMQRRLMSVVTVDEVTQGRVVVASPVCIRQLQYKHISLHPTLHWTAMLTWAASHISQIVCIRLTLSPSCQTLHRRRLTPAPALLVTSEHVPKLCFWWNPIINDSWCIIQSWGWGCVDARPLCLTKHRVLVYCWRTNSLEQSFSSPSRGELWLELFSRHSLILQFRLNTTKSLQIKYSLARSFWYCFCERPWNVKHFNNFIHWTQIYIVIKNFVCNQNYIYIYR